MSSVAKPERVAENNNVQYAIKRGLKHRKMNGMGSRSWPDQMFLGKKRLMFFIEYKVVGEEPTEKQQQMHDDLRAMGHHVYVVDDPDIGRAIIDYEINNPGGPPWQM